MRDISDYTTILLSYVKKAIQQIHLVHTCQKCRSARCQILGYQNNYQKILLLEAIIHEKIQKLSENTKNFGSGMRFPLSPRTTAGSNAMLLSLPGPADITKYKYLLGQFN